MFRKFPLIIVLLLFIALMLPITAAAFTFLLPPSVPAAAEEIAYTLDMQISKAHIDEGFAKRDLSIVCTVPVSLSNFEETNPLAFQMTEEVASLLITAGYTVSEVRKADNLFISQETAETILTRDVNQLALKESSSVAVLTGTYTMTQDNIRFTMSIIHIPSNQVLAKGSGTVGITRELLPLIYKEEELKASGALAPSVQTKLP